jgi:hypothetical protein
VIDSRGRGQRDHARPHHGYGGNTTHSAPPDHALNNVPRNGKLPQLQSAPLDEEQRCGLTRPRSRHSTARHRRRRRSASSRAVSWGGYTARSDGACRSAATDWCASRGRRRTKALLGVDTRSAGPPAYDAPW